MRLNDLKGSLDQNISSLFDKSKKGDDCEQRENSFRSTDGISPSLRISKMRGKIQRRIQSQKIFLYGSIPDHGIRTVDLSGKSERYYCLFECREQKALPYGDSYQADEKQSCPCELGAGLEDLSGVRSLPGEKSNPRTLPA